MTGGLAVWRDGAADGPTNMAADELLAGECERRDAPVIRTYAWSEPTVSLGAFQPIAEAESSAAIAGLPLVRRPSGGGAIVHGTDLTYAAAVPRGHPWGAAPQAFYDALHAAMATVLGELGFLARLHAASADDPPGDALLCFSRRSAGDLVVTAGGRTSGPTDAKVMGSAQRRLGTTVLQHGSLLLSSPPWLPPGSRHPGLADLRGGRPGWTAAMIADRWTALVADALGMPLIVQSAGFATAAGAAVDGRAARFRDRRWTARR